MRWVRWGNMQRPEESKGRFSGDSATSDQFFAERDEEATEFFALRFTGLIKATELLLGVIAVILEELAEFVVKGSDGTQQFFVHGGSPAVSLFLGLGQFLLERAKAGVEILDVLPKQYVANCVDFGAGIVGIGLSRQGEGFFFFGHF